MTTRVAHGPLTPPGSMHGERQLLGKPGVLSPGGVHGKQPIFSVISVPWPNLRAYNRETDICRLFWNARRPVVAAGSRVDLSIKKPLSDLSMWEPRKEDSIQNIARTCRDLGCTMRTGLTFASQSVLRAQPVAALPYCCLWCLEDSACGSW